MKIDNQLTERIEAWLAMPEHTDDADIMEGALMLLAAQQEQAVVPNRLYMSSTLREDSGI